MVFVGIVKNFSLRFWFSVVEDKGSLKLFGWDVGSFELGAMGARSTLRGMVA